MDAQDESVRKSWARFSHELHRSPDAPYPGMSEAFEQHFSQSFTDREWRAEASTWAAAWKAAKRHRPHPTPSVPDGWLRAIDEALVTAHIGVANAEDTYEQAKAKLDNLIGFHVDVDTDPVVNGGWKLMPVEPTQEIYECYAAYDGTSYSNPFDFDDFREDYLAAINSTGLPVGTKLYALPVAQPAPSAPGAAWLPVPDKHPTFDPVDLLLADGSVLCDCLPQSDGDYWWKGPSGEVFIDPRYAPVTHWRLSATPEDKP